MLQARHARLTARWHHAHHGRSRHRSSTRRHTWHARLSTRTLGHVHRPEHELAAAARPPPALAITFFSSPSLPPPFARGCGTPCPLCGGGVDMTHFPLFSIHATLLAHDRCPYQKKASPSSVTQSLASTTSDPFHHPRATPRASLARTRSARAIPSSSVLGPIVASRSPTRSSLSRFPTLRTRHRRPLFARPRAFDARSHFSSPWRCARASRRRAYPSSSRSIRLGRPAAVRVRRAVSDRLCRPRGASSRRGRGEVGRAGSGSPSRSPHAPSF